MGTVVTYSFKGYSEQSPIRTHLSMLEYIREIDAEAAATRRYLESMS